MTVSVLLDCRAPEADAAREQVLRILAAGHGTNETWLAEIGLVLDEIAETPEELLVRTAHLLRAFSLSSSVLAHHLAQVYGADYGAALHAVDEAFTTEKTKPGDDTR